MYFGHLKKHSEARAVIVYSTKKEGEKNANDAKKKKGKCYKMNVSLSCFLVILCCKKKTPPFLLPRDHAALKRHSVQCSTVFFENLVVLVPR